MKKYFVVRMPKVRDFQLCTPITLTVNDGTVEIPLSVYPMELRMVHPGRASVGEKETEVSEIWSVAGIFCVVNGNDVEEFRLLWNSTSVASLVETGMKFKFPYSKLSV